MQQEKHLTKRCGDCSGYKTMSPLDFIPQDEKKIIEKGKINEVPHPTPPHLKSRLNWESFFNIIKELKIQKLYTYIVQQTSLFP